MTEDGRYRDIVLSSVGKVVVDTAQLPDGRYETMVFPCKLNGIVDFSTELYCSHTTTSEAALQEHKDTIRKWKI